MNNLIAERIRIASSFKSIYNWTGKTQEKKEKTLKKVAFLDYEMVMILLALLVVVSAMSTFKIEPLFGNWKNVALLVLMTMGFSIKSPFSHIELMLHKHINQIKNLDIEFDQNLNTKFCNIIERFNKRTKYIYLFGIPLILISISAFLQVFNANPYWDLFPPIILVISIYLIARINYDILIIKKNFSKVVNLLQ
jgi:hypothetical protein